MTFVLDTPGYKCVSLISPLGGALFLHKNKSLAFKSISRRRVKKISIFTREKNFSLFRNTMGIICLNNAKENKNKKHTKESKYS